MTLRVLTGGVEGILLVATISEKRFERSDTRSLCVRLVCVCLVCA